MRYAISLLLVLTAASCSPYRFARFNIRSINTGEEDVTAVILVNDEVQLDENSRPLLTPADVSVRFDLRQPQPKAKVSVRSVTLDESGLIAGGLDERDFTEYQQTEQVTFLNDPKAQVHVLLRNRTSP